MENIWTKIEREMLENEPILILNEQIRAINVDLKKRNIVSTNEVISVKEDKIKHGLFLNVVNYKYCYITLVQNISSFYPAKLYAFNEKDFIGEFENKEEMYELLKIIFKDKRTNIIINQLSLL